MSAAARAPTSPLRTSSRTASRVAACAWLRRRKSGALDLLAQNLELQPFLFRRGQFRLGGGERSRCRVERLAVARIETGISEPLMQRSHLGLQLEHGLGQRFERVLLVEAEPAL